MLTSTQVPPCLLRLIPPFYLIESCVPGLRAPRGMPQAVSADQESRLALLFEPVALALDVDDRLVAQQPAEDGRFDRLVAEDPALDCRALSQGDLD